MAWENSSAVVAAAFAVVVAHLANFSINLPTASKIRFFHEWVPYKRWGLVQHVILKRIAFRACLVSKRNQSFCQTIFFLSNIFILWYAFPHLSFPNHIITSPLLFCEHIFFVCIISSDTKYFFLQIFFHCFRHDFDV